MITKFLSILIAASGLLTTVHGQQSTHGPVRLRAVLHDPAHPAADLFIRDQGGNRVKLELRPGDFSGPQITLPVDGKVLFYSTGSTDSKDPQAGLVATMSVPPTLKSAISILVPVPGKNPSFRTVLIEDTPDSFRKGESRVLSLVPVETAIEIGEHKLQIMPGKLTRVPVVKKVSGFNMAQTNFHFKEGASWVTFTERQLQFLDDIRRVFIISATPGATRPYVTTIVDTAPAVLRSDP
jgi:hypothetical protein